MELLQGERTPSPTLTKEEAEELIARWVTEERTALSIIRPKGGAD